MIDTDGLIDSFSKSNLDQAEVLFDFVFPHLPGEGC